MQMNVKKILAGAMFLFGVLLVASAQENLSFKLDKGNEAWSIADYTRTNDPTSFGRTSPLGCVSFRFNYRSPSFLNSVYYENRENEQSRKALEV
jgi:hypothetical protein